MKRLFIKILSFSLLFAFVAVGFSICALRHTENLKSEAVEATALTAAGEDRIVRFLVMGVDRAAKLTDSMFVVALNETQRSARILQLPRDTYAEYTDSSYKKLNGACHALGESGIKEWMSESLGVPIHYFVILDLSCLRAIVDAIGGVDIVIPQDMKYSDPSQELEIDLHAGQAHLDGKKSEEFIRFRAGYVNADLGRLDAQKLFLKAFAKACCSLSPKQIFRATCIALTKLQTDIGLPEAIRVVSILRECDTDHIPMATIAGQAEQGSSGAWYYVLNREGACEMVKDYLFPLLPYEDRHFDPKGVFDRMENKKFHNIYTAPPDSLPMG